MGKLDCWSLDNPYKTYVNGTKILCTTYLKTNLIYDLETNTAGENGRRLTSFTEIFYHDWRNKAAKDREKRSWGKITGKDSKGNRGKEFDGRYLDFQDVSSDLYPGYTVAPVKVDVMFEILSINDRKINKNTLECNIWFKSVTFGSGLNNIGLNITL